MALGHSRANAPTAALASITYSTRLLGSLAYLVAVYLAAITSKTHPILVSILAAAPLPVLYALVLLVFGAGVLDIRLAPLLFGWRPHAVGFAFVVSILTLITGYCAGLFALSVLQERPGSITDESSTAF